MKVKKELHDMIRYRVKPNRVLRAFLRPIMERKYRFIYEEYLHSGYPEELCKIKGSHKGERCFIIGNGPSLAAADLTKLKKESTFAANRIFDIFDQTDWRPTFYVSNDPRFFEDSYEEIYAHRMERHFLEYRKLRDKAKRDDTTALFQLPFFQVNTWDLHPYISEDLACGFSDGGTVTYTSIQLALYMGFREIYLLGVDFNYSVVRDAKGKITQNKNVVDYFSGRPNPRACLCYDNSLRAYQAARAYCDAHGILIKNSTRGGKLEVFERVDFDQIIRGGNSYHFIRFWTLGGLAA